MWEKIWAFITEHWLDLLLAIGGLSAFFIYISQEKRKVSDAASLIILQVEDLQKRISEIGSFIVNGNIDCGAFYESQPIFKTNYWNEYKHYFVKEMDAFSFNTFDDFFNSASQILEQQQLMKDLQKQNFFLIQQTLMQMESNAIVKSLDIAEQNPVDITQLAKVAENAPPDNIPPEQKEALKNMMMQIVFSNVHANMNVALDVFGKRKNDIHTLINQKILTPYIPDQIRISIENALKKHHSISIIGCEGYRKLKKIGNR
ncbi:MAG: hypothetical protein IJA86_09545 [Clostridia bacterium]|nr:hypothetical protein [Clostridia bacterium]